MQKLLGQVRRCVEDYHMIDAGDTVAVGVSGGKDSLVTLTALARLRAFYPIPFTVHAITLETGAPGMSFDAVADLCRQLEVPYTRIQVPVYDIVFNERKEKNPCSLCAKLRRGSLNTALTDLGIRKIALGHHYDDAIETLLMNLLFEGRIGCFQPVTYLDRTGITQIRPLLYCREEEIRRVSGVEQGDNLFTLNKYQISSRIYTQLPYIGTVNFERKYPDTFVIHVTASVPVAWIESGGSRWLMDTDCKLLESGGASLTEGKAQVRGLEAVNPSVGSVLTVPPEQQDKLDQLKGFLAAIQARQMTGSLTSFLDLTSNNEIRFGYGANLTVLFPMNGDFTQKTYYLQQTLWTMDEKGIPRTGTLDLTYDNQEGHLLPKRWLPEASTAPELSPPPAAEAGTQGENDANEKTDAE